MDDSIIVAAVILFVGIFINTSGVVITEIAKLRQQKNHLLASEEKEKWLYKAEALKRLEETLGEMRNMASSIGHTRGDHFVHTWKGLYGKAATSLIILGKDIDIKPLNTKVNSVSDNISQAMKQQEAMYSIIEDLAQIVATLSIE